MYISSSQAAIYNTSLYVGATSTTTSGNISTSGTVNAYSCGSIFGNGSGSGSSYAGGSTGQAVALIGNNQSSSGGWIGGAFTSQSQNSYAVVAGGLSGYSGGMLAAHTYPAFNNWAPLYVQQGVIFTASDSNIKTDIVSANSNIMYQTIKSLNLVRYKMNSNIVPDLVVEDTTRTGVIAQHFQKHFPKSCKMLFGSNSGSNMYNHQDILTINTDQAFFTLIGAVQKLMNDVEILTAQLNNLNTR